MTRTLSTTIKSLVAALLLMITLVTFPVSAYAADRTTTVATIEATMMAQFPEGTPWDNSTVYVSTITINGTKLVYTGYGCVGFALNFVETAFGKGGSYNKIMNCPVANIQAGDIVRVPNATGGHAYVIIAMDATGATIAEANYNSSVHYNRHVTLQELATNDYVMQRL